MPRLLATLLLACLASGAAGAASDDRWYRIEVIVFAYTEASTSTETWLPDARSYPSDVIAIGRANPIPTSYAQIEDTLRYDRLVGEGTPPAGSRPRSSNTFLFETESRFFDEDSGTLLRQTEVMERELASADDALATGETGPADNADATPIDDLMAIEEILTTPGPVPYRRLPEEARELRRTARSINRSKRYRLLDHLLWTQPITPQSRDARVPAAILIEAGSRYDDIWELAGTLTFTRSRYLHVDADLTFTAFTQTGEGRAHPVPAGLAEEDLDDFASVVAWESSRGAFEPDGFARMQRSQRLPKGEVHYVDHPYFGLLIRIDDYAFEIDANN